MSVAQNEQLTQYGLPIIGTGAFIALWQLVSGVFELIDPLLLPPPTSIVNTLTEFSDLIADAFISTLTAAAIGYIVAIVLSLATAIILTENDTAYMTFMPLIVGTNSLPKVAMAPVVIFYFSSFGKPLVGAWIAFFPMVINTMHGLNTVDDDFMLLLDSLNASAWQEYRMVRIPNALPFIFDGLKIGVTLSVIGVITAEFILPTGGIGGLALLALMNYQSSLAFAVVIVTGIISVLVFFALFLLQDRLVHWKQSAMFTEG